MAGQTNMDSYVPRRQNLMLRLITPIVQIVGGDSSLKLYRYRVRSVRRGGTIGDQIVADP